MKRDLIYRFDMAYATTSSKALLVLFSLFQMVFALSPLLLLGYILFTAFESEEVENKKRNKKTDFDMAGHAE